MTLDDKHDIIFHVLENEMIESVRKGVSDYFNSEEFKMELKMRLSNRNVEVDFKDMNNTKVIHNIEMDKYSVFFDEDLHDDIVKDLIIH